MKKHQKRRKAVDEVKDFERSGRLHSKFKKKKTHKRRKLSEIVEAHVDLAGLEMRWRAVKRRLLIGAAIICAILTTLVIIGAINYGSWFSDWFLLVLSIWIVLFPAAIVLLLALFFLYLDIRIRRRTKEIEVVLPDFLQLTSANISAGMPIDRALWLAVRPQFGVLSYEMQELAKANISGDDLESSLLRFSKRYRSRMLKEAVSLIIAGIRSGGELGDLLSRIAENIRQTQLMQKEIAASVMTYVIFIGAATVVASPVLFALSRQMLMVISTLTASFGEGGTQGVGSFALQFSSEGVSMQDFTIFSIVLIGISCYFASGIISAIRKGDSSEQLKLFPVFYIIGVILFFVAAYLLGQVFAGLSL